MRKSLNLKRKKLQKVPPPQLNSYTTIISSAVFFLKNVLISWSASAQNTGIKILKLAYTTAGYPLKTA